MISIFKSWARCIARIVAGCETLWSCLPGRLKNHAYVQVQRSAALEKRFRILTKRLFSGNVVLEGPFCGLVFPSDEIIGSAYWPKLLGSYECEIAEELEKMIGKSPPCVIDIGFAEGYYLVGLGRRLPQAALIGFDANVRAHVACRQLAEMNGVDPGRITFYEKAENLCLERILPAESLIICDIEGGEAELFRKGDLDKFRLSHLIIECHDFIYPGTSEFISGVLSDTHDIDVVCPQAVEDKFFYIPITFRQRMSESDKKRLVEEGRPGGQSWVVGTPKSRREGGRI